jgi:hypothetical protein
VDHQINEEPAKQESYRQQLVRHARDVYVFLADLLNLKVAYLN